MPELNNGYIQGDVGVYHISDDRANYDLYEVERSDHFEFIIPDELNRLVRFGASSESSLRKEGDYINGGQEIIRLSVTSAFFPSISVEPITITRGNSSMKAAGHPKWTGGQIKVNDFIGARTKEVLWGWFRLAYDVITDKIGRMKNYKQDCYLVEYTADYEMIKYWELKGCFVSGVQEEGFSSTSTGKREVTATIEFDKAIPHLPDDGPRA